MILSRDLTSYSWLKSKQL